MAACSIIAGSVNVRGATAVCGSLYFEFNCHANIAWGITSGLIYKKKYSYLILFLDLSISTQR